MHLPCKLSFIITQTLKLYSEGLLVFKLCTQVNDGGNEENTYFPNIETIKLANGKKIINRFYRLKNYHS